VKQREATSARSIACSRKIIYPEARICC